MKKGNSRANIPIVVNRLISLFKHEMATSESSESGCKMKKETGKQDSNVNCNQTSEFSSTKKKSKKTKKKRKKSGTVEM